MNLGTGITIGLWCIIKWKDKNRKVVDNSDGIRQIIKEVVLRTEIEITAFMYLSLSISRLKINYMYVGTTSSGMSPGQLYSLQRIICW